MPASRAQQEAAEREALAQLEPLSDDDKAALAAAQDAGVDLRPLAEAYAAEQLAQLEPLSDDEKLALAEAAAAGVDLTVFNTDPQAPAASTEPPAGDDVDVTVGPVDDQVVPPGPTAAKTTPAGANPYDRLAERATRAHEASLPPAEPNE